MYNTFHLYGVVDIMYASIPENFPGINNMMCVLSIILWEKSSRFIIIFQPYIQEY